jgi:hypothetical protein
MVAIGVGVVHLRKRADIAKHELLGLNAEHRRLRRDADPLELELGHLMNPKAVAERAKAMNIDLNAAPVRLAGPADETPRRNGRATN